MPSAILGENDHITVFIHKQERHINMVLQLDVIMNYII